MRLPETIGRDMARIDRTARMVMLFPKRRCCLFSHRPTSASRAGPVGGKTRAVMIFLIKNMMGFLFGICASDELELSGEG